MRLLIVNPNTTESITIVIHGLASAAASAGTALQVVTAPWGPASIECHLDAELAGVALVEVIASMDRQVDGVVIAAFGDPGLYAARELARVPVIGIGEAAMLTACTVAHRFSVVTVQPRSRPMLMDQVRRYGLSQRCASIRAASASVLESQSDPARTERLLIEQSRTAIEVDGAEAICLGGAPLGVYRAPIQFTLGVPVIEPVGSAVRLVEALVGAGLTTSRVAAFRRPEIKTLAGHNSALSALRLLYGEDPAQPQL